MCSLYKIKLKYFEKKENKNHYILLHLQFSNEYRG